MKFFTSKLQLSNVIDNQPENLLKLVNNIKVRQSKNNKKPRLIEDIIKDIETNNPENISSIEWIYLLFNLRKWEKTNQKQSTLIAQKIWEFAERDNFLKLKLFWRLILNHFEPDKKYLPPSLVNSFITFNTQTYNDKTTLIITKLLLSDSYEELALLFCKILNQPEEILKKINLPYKFNLQNNLTLVETIKIQIPLALSELKIEEKHINYLISNLNTLSSKSQLMAVENLLLNTPPMIGGNYPKLVTWLKTHYGLTGDNSQWHQLSPRAKNALKQWIGAVNYKDFEKLINIIADHLSYLVEQANSYDEKERIKRDTNQLHSRKIFWSNYSDRFERIRILLPISTVNIVGNVTNTEEIITLKNDGSEVTEVCIFDFNDWFIVEFFRGKGSETRIFPKRDELENLLFNSDDISLKILRRLTISRDNVHDHKFCWQNSCEKLLRNKLIYPNANTRFFKILENREGFPYSFETGMPLLTQKQISDRERQLKYWQKEINDLEKESEEYIDKDKIDPNE